MRAPPDHIAEALCACLLRPRRFLHTRRRAGNADQASARVTLGPDVPSRRRSSGGSDLPATRPKRRQNGAAARVPRGARRDRRRPDDGAPTDARRTCVEEHRARVPGLRPPAGSVCGAPGRLRRDCLTVCETRPVSRLRERDRAGRRGGQRQTSHGRDHLGHPAVGSRMIGVQSRVAQRSLTRVDDLLDLVRVREVLGERLARRVEHRDEHDAARAARAALRADGRRRGTRARCSSTARRGRCAAITSRSPTTSASASAAARVSALGRDRFERVDVGTEARGERRRDRRRRPSIARADCRVRARPARRCGSPPGRRRATRRAPRPTSVGQHADAVGPAERRVREVHDPQVGAAARAAARARARAGSPARARRRRRARPRRRSRRRTLRSPRRTRPTLRGSGGRSGAGGRGRRDRGCRNHSTPFETTS